MYPGAVAAQEDFPVPGPPYMTQMNLREDLDRSSVEVGNALFRSSLSSLFIVDMVLLK
jgi:hypothetical protein